MREKEKAAQRRWLDFPACFERVTDGCCHSNARHENRQRRRPSETLRDDRRRFIPRALLCGADLPVQNKRLTWGRFGRATP